MTPEAAPTGVTIIYIRTVGQYSWVELQEARNMHGPTTVESQNN